MLIRFNADDERETVKWMITYFCLKNHKEGEICSRCLQLLEYAGKRIDHCPHGAYKPVCSNCEIHCYKDIYRERIREVMKFSGPRVIFRKPVFGMKYLIKKKFYKNNKKPL